MGQTVSDEADIASREEEAFRNEALRRARRNVQPHVRARKYCEDCGMPIPKARRRAVPGAHRCTDCQATLERRSAA